MVYRDHITSVQNINFEQFLPCSINFYILSDRKEGNGKRRKTELPSHY